MSDAANELSLLGVEVGEQLPERVHTPGNVQLMLYNAVLWNGHRIHFDEPYATQVEAYPGLVIAGPLLGDWMHQCVEEWLGERGRLTGIQYSNRIATYIGETLVAGGTVSAVDTEAGEVTIDTFIRDADGGNVSPGTVTVRMGAGD